MRDKEIDFKEYSTAVTVCPDCGRHSALRLNWAFVAARKGQEILVVCLNCALLRIGQLKKDSGIGSKLTPSAKQNESAKPVDVVYLLSAEDIQKF